MLVRFNWKFKFSPLIPRETAPAQRHGRFLPTTITLTTLFLLWLLYRALAQPGWVNQLPALFGELLFLVEAGGGVTLMVLWGLFFWQRHKPTPLPPPTAVTLDQLYALSPAEFERYVATLFRQKGYRVKRRGRSGDKGVDLEINRQGRKAIVQCKRYRNTIGPDIVRELYGTLIHERALHSFLVTTADISDGAREWARGKPMTLIDGGSLILIAASLSQRHDR